MCEAFSNYNFFFLNIYVYTFIVSLYQVFFNIHTIGKFQKFGFGSLKKKFQYFHTKNKYD